MPRIGDSGVFSGAPRTFTVVNDEMAAAVGSELRRAVSFPIAASDLRRWAIAVYWPEPPPAYFWDAEAAASTRCGVIVAPQEFNPFAWMTSAGPVIGGGKSGGHDPDSIEKGLGVRAPGLSHQLNGGLEVEYGARMRTADVITSVTRLGGYTERAGRLGWMLFTAQEDTWTNQDGELVKRSRMTLIRY